MKRMEFQLNVLPKVTEKVSESGCHTDPDNFKAHTLFPILRHFASVGEIVSVRKNSLVYIWLAEETKCSVTEIVK